MCNACGFSCCACDAFDGCGCECHEPLCWERCDYCGARGCFGDCPESDGADDDYAEVA